MLTAMEDYREPRGWDDRIAGLETPGFLPEEASPEAHEAERRSAHTRFRRRFLELARNMAEEEGLGPNERRTQDLIGNALVVAESMLYAFPSLGSDSAAKAKMSAGEVKERLKNLPLSA